jgi:uncharacterized protein (DUF2141 family)
MKRTMILLMAATLFAAQRLAAQSLTIEVRGIEKPVGTVYVAFYNSAETFMKKPVAAFGVAATDSVLRIPCKGLPPGTYAFSLFQDENDNRQLDTGTFGIPKEKYAFSNDAQGVMGPPSYGKCRFTLRADTTMRVGMR